MGAMQPHRAALLVALLACVGFFSSPASAARLQRWLYYSVNLWVDTEVAAMDSVLARAAQAGYTHVLVADSKFARLDEMDAHYFSNVAHVKNTAAALGLEIVPALFPIGYSNDLLSHDPSLIEALPVENSLLVVSNGLARVQPDPPVAFRGGDFSDLSLWDWKDDTVVADNGTARVSDPLGANARIVQELTVSPFRQYHISVHIKTQDFAGTPEVKVLAPSGELNYNRLGVLPSQDWQTYHVVFNSLTNRQVTVYLGCWDGTTGTLWWDEAKIEELAFLNLVRRPGAPLTVQREGGPLLVEGVDYPAFKDPLMGVNPRKGHYDDYHPLPLLQVNAADGTRLRACWYHAVTVYNGRAMICPSEPATLELLGDQAQRMHAAWGAKGYMMCHDEIRVLNWCAACQQRNLDAGAILASNVQACIQILRQVNPGGNIYVWSDMFDPNHNAHDNYYLVRGNLTNSWLGLDPDVIIVPWDFEQRAASLEFFAGRGHRQVIAGYYDSTPDQIGQWLDTAQAIPGILGVIYTTWQSRYGDLEAFSEVVSDFEIHHSWQLGVRRLAGGLQIELPTLSGQSYTLSRTTDLSHWQPWTNFTSTAAITRCLDSTVSGRPGALYRATTGP